MLSQLKNLGLETDGRYATDAELAFLKAYLQSARQRISAYEKIRDAEGRHYGSGRGGIDGSRSTNFPSSL